MDKILKDINEFGSYQKLVLFIIGAMSSLNAMTIYATVFIAAEPELKCRFKNELNNSNITIKSYDKCEIWKNFPNNCEWDKKYYGLTIITEFELICDRAYLAGLTQVFYFNY